MYIDKNIELLGYNPLNSIGIPEVADFNLKYLESVNDVDYFSNFNGEIIGIQDKLDEEQAPNKNIRQLVIAFGIHSPKALNKLYKSMNNKSLLVIIEPNSALFNSALLNKELSVFKYTNVVLFSNELKQLPPFLLELMGNFNYFSLLNNTHFYFTDYYQKNDFDITKKYIETIRKNFKAQLNLTGNSIEDSLEGLQNNFKNILHIIESKNPHYLYEKYKGKPAIVIAAGPSLEKNVKYLKEAQDKAIIFAVDTVIKKILNLGVVPDFVCSIERVPEVYEYFYKDIDIPEKVTLVGPSLLDSRIFENYTGNWILPYRFEVAEYKWLAQVMKAQGNIGMLMGTSCAHVAFGMAVHLGASPIILIGQDLAYGNEEGKSHVSDTIYDEIGSEVSVAFREDYIEGYFGETVKTTDIWLMFKVWYERMILRYDLKVINATEGGAKIAHTEQMSFKDAIERYCDENVGNIFNDIKDIPTYNFSKDMLVKEFKKELSAFEEIRKEAENLYSKYDQMLIDSLTIRNNLNTIQEELNKFDLFVQKSTSHPLMIHNIQGFVLKTSWDLSSIEDIISVDTLNGKKAVYIKFLIVIISTSKEIEKQFLSVINRLKEASEIENKN